MSGVLLLRGTQACKREAIVLENIWFFDENEWKGKTEGESSEVAPMKYRNI